MIAPSDHIQVLLKTDKQSITDVELISKRTLVAARALEGKSVHDTLNLLPLLFSLCGTAQHHASLMAIENALGIVPSKTQENLRNILLDAESIGEHITRIMMDWSSHAYVDTKMSKIRDSRKKLSEFKKLLFKDHTHNLIGGAPFDIQIDILHRHLISLIDVCEQDIFGCPLDHFYSLHSQQDLKVWQTGNNAVASACLKIWNHNGFFEDNWAVPNVLPKLPEVFLEHRLDGDDADQFIAEPSYDRTGYETGPLSRHLEHPLIKSQPTSAIIRLLAKLLDLAKLLLDLPEKINEIGNDEKHQKTKPTYKGLGQVEAVRGFLTHRVWLCDQGDIVQRYRILAPTEWNFHPDGPLKEALIGTKFNDNRKLMEQVRLYVLALDPCVACDIQLADMD